MKNSILLTLFGVVIAAVPAMASPAIIDFTTTGGTGTGSAGNDLSAYSVTVGGLTATAYAFFATGTASTGPNSSFTGPNQSNPAVIGQYSNPNDGLGVCETNGGTGGTLLNCGSGYHQISNTINGSTYDYEFVLVAFTAGTNLDPVALNAVQLGNFGGAGAAADPFGVTYYTSTTTASLNAVETALEGAGTPGTGNLTSGGVTFTSHSSPTCLTGQAAIGTGVDNAGTPVYNDNCAVNGNGIEDLSGTGVTYLLIGAAVNGSEDYFKLQGLSVTTPEPATFGMLGIAFVGLGLAFRKRKSS